MHCLAKKRRYLDLKLLFLISHKQQQREKIKLFDSAPIVSNAHKPFRYAHTDSLCEIYCLSYKKSQPTLFQFWFHCHIIDGLQY